MSALTKVVPYVVQPGSRLRRHQTDTRAGKTYGPGDTVYLIERGGAFFSRAFSSASRAWSVVGALARTTARSPRINHSDSFSKSVPTTVI